MQNVNLGCRDLDGGKVIVEQFATITGRLERCSHSRAITTFRSMVRLDWRLHQDVRCYLRRARAALLEDGHVRLRHAGPSHCSIEFASLQV